jgi:hypothetical protein
MRRWSALDAGTYLDALDVRLHLVTHEVNVGAPKNEALAVDREKGTWRLAPTRAHPAQLSAKAAKALIENAMPGRELLDIVIDLDARLDVLGHFLHAGEGSKLPRNVRRCNVLAALMAVGCNIGPARMAAASGLSAQEISWRPTGT